MSNQAINIGDKVFLGAYGWITIKGIEERCGPDHRFDEPYEVVVVNDQGGALLEFKLTRKEE